MADAQQDRLPLNVPQMAKGRSSRRTVIESRKLYGFKISDADLERTDWTFRPAESFRYTTLHDGNCKEFITAPEDHDSGGYSRNDPTYLSLLYARWERSLLVKGSFDDTQLPISSEVRSMAQQERWITEEYRHLWHNDSGGSAALTEVAKSGFILQTPNDGGPFCSLSISEVQPSGSNVSSCGGIYIADEDYNLESLLASYSLPDNEDPVCKFLVMSMVLPIRILQKHTEATRKQLVDLAKYLTETEQRIALGQVLENTEDDNKLLNGMNLEHMKIHRRWNFEKELGTNILRYFDTAGARDNGKHKQNVKAYTKLMRDQVERQIRYSEALNYDFETIPKRIRNQSKAIFNLMIQRDNQLNLSIAEHSRNLNKINTEIATSSAKIAEESRRDSASMKTIAVLTLVFLPGTAVASIFSMTMFNWNAGPGERITSERLWVYFAVTIPLTLVILTAWSIFYYFFQKPRTDVIRDLELQLPLPPLPSIRTNTLPVKGEKYI